VGSMSHTDKDEIQKVVDEEENVEDVEEEEEEGEEEEEEVKETEEEEDPDTVRNLLSTHSVWLRM
jgi:hypothetical protein